MPVDTSMYSTLQQPKQQGPLDRAAQMLSLKQMIDQSGLSELQKRKLETDLAEESDFKGVLRDASASGADMNAPDFMKKAMGASPSRGIALQKSLLEQQQAGENLKKTQLANEAAKTQKLRDTAASVSDDAGMKRVRDTAVQLFGYQIASSMGIPDTFSPQWQQQFVMNGDQLLAKMKPHMQQAGDRFVDTNPASNPGIGNVRIGLTPNESANLQIKGAEATPGGAFSIPDIVARYTGGGAQPAAAQPSAAGAVPAAGAPPAATGMPANPVQAALASGATGEELLSQLPKPVADQVKAMVEGRMAPPSSFALKTPYWQGMLSLGAQYEPSFDQTLWGSRSATRKAFAAGTEGRNLTAINTAVGHLDSFDKAAAALNNGDYPAFNKFLNAVGPQVGATNLAGRVRTFEQAKEAVSNELMRVFRGAGASSSDTAKWAETLNASDSPEALRKAVRGAVDLLESRIGALSEQYKKGMGTDSQVDVLNMVYPKSRATLERLRSGGKEEAAKAAPAAEAPKPQEFSSLPDPAKFEGRRMQADDGTIYKATGGRWVKQ